MPGAHHLRDAVVPVEPLLDAPCEHIVRIRRVQTDDRHPEVAPVERRPVAGPQQSYVWIDPTETQVLVEDLLVVPLGALRHQTHPLGADLRYPDVGQDIGTI